MHMVIKRSTLGYIFIELSRPLSLFLLLFTFTFKGFSSEMLIEERYLEGDQAQELIILLKQGGLKKEIKINGKDQLGLK